MYEMALPTQNTNSIVEGWPKELNNSYDSDIAAPYPLMENYCPLRHGIVSLAVQDRLAL